MLRPRLEAVLGLLEPCAVLADIGTDHALLPLAAVQRGLASRAIGIDQYSGPLRMAAHNLSRAGHPAVTLIQGDGLQPLAAAPPDAVVIAGLTGPTVVRLCAEACPVLASVRQLILQPVRDIHRVRAWARGAGWWLRDEALVFERGRFFAACAFRPGIGPDPAYDLPDWSPAALDRLGPHLIRRRDARLVEEVDLRLRYAEEKLRQGVLTFEGELVFWGEAARRLTGGSRAG